LGEELLFGLMPKILSQVLLELEKDYPSSNKPLSVAGHTSSAGQLAKQDILLCEVSQLGSECFCC